VRRRRPMPQKALAIDDSAVTLQMLKLFFSSRPAP
jgi:hypothetical protein